MARKVFVSSAMSADEELSEIADHEPLVALMWPWFITYLDDWGRAKASPREIKNNVFQANPLVTIDVIKKALQMYKDKSLISTELLDGKEYIICRDWLHLQYDGRLPRSAWIEIRQIVFQRDNYTCKYCGKRGGDLECDHVNPVSRGGSNDLDNLATACKSCNREKGKKTEEEWRR